MPRFFISNNKVLNITGILFLFLTLLNIRNSSADITSCVSKTNDYKEKCMELMSAGEEAEYTMDCSELGYQRILCACLYNVDSCGDTLSKDDLNMKIAAAVRAEYELMGENISTTDYLKDFTHPLGGDMEWVKDFSGEHSGIDFAGNVGDPIYAMNTGTVVYAGYDRTGKYGNMVIIDHGNGFKTVYGHLEDGSINVLAGTEIPGGTLIGALGNTGASSGPHLHLEVRFKDYPKDPKVYLYENDIDKFNQELYNRLSLLEESEYETTFSDEDLIKIGQDIVDLNFNFPMEFMNLPEEQKATETKRVMTKYAEELHIRNGNDANDAVVAAYVMDDMLNISPAEAYAWIKLNENKHNDGTEDIFKMFFDEYIKTNVDKYFDITHAEDGTNGDHFATTYDSMSKREIDNKMKLVEEEISKRKYDPDNPGKYDLYNLTLAETVNTTDFTTVSSWKKDNMQIEIYNVEGFDPKDIQVMKVKFNLDHDSEGELDTEYLFTVTQNVNYRNPEIKNGKGTVQYGDSITFTSSRDITTLYPMTDPGVLALIAVNNNFKSRFVEPRYVE
ncbi:MAG: peptidoglycan DD-metalloendopeptidase family protein [Anaerolineaceae bacterium]|nr:peptidoglycan DD-metalloendopeptidase family protein [Anaerolineaceae bacterium]